MWLVRERTAILTLESLDMPPSPYDTLLFLVHFEKPSCVFMALRLSHPCRHMHLRLHGPKILCNL